MIYTSLSPNTQGDDFVLAFKTLLDLKSYKEGVFVSRVRDWFKNFFNVRHAATFESARTALFFALKALEVKSGDEVNVQAFTCVAAVNPIKWAGGKVVYADINPKTFNIDLNDLENKISDKQQDYDKLTERVEGTKALIEQHNQRLNNLEKELIEKNKNIEDSEEKQILIKQQIEEAEADLKKMENKRSISEQKLKKTDSNLSELKKNLNTIEKAIRATESQIE